MKKLILCFGLITLFITACTNPTSTKETAIEPIMNANQFSTISKIELGNILGEAKITEDWNYSSPNGNSYKTTTCGYDIRDGLYAEFMIIDDSVVRCTIYTNWYSDPVDLGVGLDKELLEMFDIVPNDNLKVIANTNSALRYRPVSDTVAEFWALSSDDKIDMVKITFNLNYFE